MWPAQPIHVGTFGELCANLACAAAAYAHDFGEERGRLSLPPSPKSARKRAEAGADSGGARAAAVQRHQEWPDDGRGRAHSDAEERSGIEDTSSKDASAVVTGAGSDDREHRKRRLRGFQPRNFARSSLPAFGPLPPAPSMAARGQGQVFGTRIAENEVLLRVQWQHRHRPTKVLEFNVLSSQTLSELVDAVYKTDRWCLSSTQEDAILKDPSRTWTRTPTYMFIDETFYIDGREEENAAFGREQLAAFALHVSPPGQAAYSVKKMEETFLRDLSVKPGVKYLFCHCGNCEHALIFTQISRATEQDRLLPREMFPLQVWKTRVLQRRCCICDKQLAQWATYGDPMSRTTPGFFCSDCFTSAHYSPKTGEILFEFKCYPYYHDELQG